MLPRVGFGLAAVITALLYSLIVHMLIQISDIKQFTAAQTGVAIAYGFVLVVWLSAEAGFFLFRLRSAL